MDLYYAFIWLFSLAFFGLVTYKAVVGVRTYVKKEKELNALDEKFDDFKRHRSNLLVLSAH